MARSFLTKTESLSSAGYSNKGIVEKYGSIGAFLTKLEEFAELNEEIQEDVVELQNAVEAADEVEAVVEQQETNVAAMEGEEISSEPVKVESDGGEIIEVTPAQPDLSENSTPEEVTDVIVAEETKVERILQRLSRDQVRSKSEILGIYGVSCHKLRTEDIRSNSLFVYKQKMEENKNFLSKIWEKIAAFFRKIWETIKNFFKGKAIEAKADEIKTKEEEIKEIVKSNPGLQISEADFDAKVKEGKISNLSPALFLYISFNDEFLNLAQNPDRLIVAVSEYAKTINTLIKNLRDKSSNGIVLTGIKKAWTSLKNIIGDEIDVKREHIKKVVNSELAGVVCANMPIGREVRSALPNFVNFINGNRKITAELTNVIKDKFGADVKTSDYFPYAFTSSKVAFYSPSVAARFTINIDDDFIRSSKLNNRALDNLFQRLESVNVDNISSSLKKSFERVSSYLDQSLKDVDDMVKNKHAEINSEDPILKAFLGESTKESEAEKLTKVVHSIIADMIKRSLQDIATMLTEITNMVLGISALYTFAIKLSKDQLASANKQ